VTKSPILLVPAHHPLQSLPDLIRDMLTIEPDLFGAAIVVDDGNEAEWQPIFDAIKQIPNANVLRRATNGGKGAALKAGAAEAIARWPETAGIVTADADGQHSPKDVARVARALARAPESLVLGARQFSADVPLRSRLGNELTRTLFRVVTGAQLMDTQTGLRGWPREAARRNLSIKGDKFEYELAALLESLSLPRIEVPIETIYEDSNRLSHFRPVQDSVRVYSVLLRFALTRRT
jgi:glycosyltransferase involved in cell wall biosynthesis